MNIEENRLRTFDSWPANSVIEPARIAKGGFFSTGQNFEVECFACGCKISDWNYGDQVMTRHRILNAQCPFVLSPTQSGNVALTPAATTSTSHLEPRPSTQSLTQDMSVETNRLLTFANWPFSNIVSPKSLAKAGFYYINDDDRVKCFKCKGLVGHWEAGDQPLNEHKRLFPNCEFVRQGLRLEEKSMNSTSYNERVMSQNNLQELGIQMHKSPHQAKYATFESRLRSFEGWPEELVQTPEALAEAGFYYTGSSDQVRCFHCDGGLRRWDPQDEPWKEHARCFPHCSFLLLVKGQTFVTECSEANASSESIVDGNPDRRIRTEPFDRLRVISDQELQRLMDSPEARAALGVGLHVGRIKQAIKYKMEHTGTSFLTADALIEAALNIQLEEPTSLQEDDDEPRNTTVLDEVCRRINQRTNHNSYKNNETVVKSQNVAISNAENLEKPADTVEKTLSLEEENRRLKEARLCKICLDTEVGIVFLPCGHLATCINCAPNLKDCPVCRSLIKAYVRTFLS